VSDALDEGLVQRIDACGTTEWTGTCYRLDLRTPEAREAVGLDDGDVYGDDWSACQAVGHAAWFLHMQGILVPAAGGVVLVIAAYEQRTRPGRLEVGQRVDLTSSLYRELRANWPARAAVRMFRACSHGHSSVYIDV
jgi:RES domain-containing protein